MNFGALFFSFSGRINRGKLWLASLMFVAGWLVFGALIFASDYALPVILVAVVYVLAVLVSGIAVGVKRLHDRDKSAWWLLVFYVVPGLLSGGGGSLGTDTIVGAGLSFAGLALSIWGFIELGCLRGTVGPNRYGDDPLG